MCMKFILFLLPFILALLTLFIVSRSLSPRFFKKIPVSRSLYFVCNLSFVIVPTVCMYFASSFVIDTFIVGNKILDQTVELEEIAVSGVDMLARRALRQGSDFSVTLSQFLRLQDHMQIQQQKQAIQVADNRSLNEVKRASEACWNVLVGQLKEYGVSVVELSQRDKAYLVTAKSKILQDELTPRERMVCNLLFSHVESYYNTGLIYEEAVLSDFTKSFRQFNQ